MCAPAKVCQKQIFADEGFGVYTVRLLSNQTFTEGLEVCTDRGQFVYSRSGPTCRLTLGGVQVSSYTRRSSSSCIVVMNCCREWVVLTNTEAPGIEA
jgi:hypothetical protein